MVWSQILPPGGVEAHSLKSTFWPKRNFAKAFFSNFFGPNWLLGQGTTHNFFLESCFFSNSFYGPKRNLCGGRFRVFPFQALWMPQYWYHSNAMKVNNMQYTKSKIMAFLSKITRSRHTIRPFAAIPVVLECWLRCLLIALGVLHIIYLHSFTVVSILWHVKG